MLRDIDTPLAVVDGVLRGNAASWEIFAEIYTGPMTDLAKMYAVRWGVDESEAEEAVQRIFVSIAQKRRRYDRSRGPFRYWLMLLVKSQVADLARAAYARAVRERRGGERLADACEEPCCSDGEMQRVRRRLAMKAFVCVLNDCTPRTREAFRRYVLRREPAHSVAGTLGLRVNALYQIRWRILNRVARLLDEAPDV